MLGFLFFLAALNGSLYNGVIGDLSSSALENIKLVFNVGQD